MEFNTNFWFTLSIYESQKSLIFSLAINREVIDHTSQFSSYLIDQAFWISLLGPPLVIIMMIIMHGAYTYLLCDLIQSPGFIHRE